VPDDEVARLERFLAAHALEQVLCRQAFQHHRRAGLERDRLGQLDDGLRRHHARDRIASRRAAAVGGAVARLEVGDAGADRLDDAGAFVAHGQRHRQCVDARALVDVDVVEPGGVLADADLARTGIADRQVDELHLFGAAGFLDPDRRARGRGGHRGLAVSGGGALSCQSR
jgi:hypothetical protein